MKAFIVFVLLVAGTSASIFPQSFSLLDPTRNERFISDTIISMIEDVSERIRDAGLDPLISRKEELNFGLPVPVLFNAAAYVEELLSTGLSNIVVNSMSYSIFTSRLNFDIELPLIHISAGVAAGEVTVFGRSLEARGDGRVDIQRIRIVGEVVVNIGISGISIRSVKTDFALGGIKTNIRLAIQGLNYSHHINTLLMSTIPDILKEFRLEVNELLDIVLLDVLNDIL